MGRELTIGTCGNKIHKGDVCNKHIIAGNIFRGGFHSTVKESPRTATINCIVVIF